MIRVEVVRGQRSGTKIESSADAFRIGRAPESDLSLPDGVVSANHAQIQYAGERYVVVDLKSTNGTAIRRGDERVSVAADTPIALTSGDQIELGHGDQAVLLSVTIVDDDGNAHVLAVRRIDDLAPATTKVEEDTSRLRALYEAQRDAGPQGYVPVLTRVRGPTQPSGPIPITRSVFRKVISERAAVVAADAPREVGQTESLMGASIRATMGVPLWRGAEILGVLQLDNRESAGVFTNGDLELVAVLAHNASLAVANARLVKRLRAAEDRLRKENQFLKGREQERRTGSRGGKQEIIGSSSAMRALLVQLDKVVDTRVTVLIEGETGVGKELIAAAVHYRSRRKDKLFVGQNCAAMPENLLESELFGHKKGAFTGAHEEKKGLFEIADGGTLFLDEVTEMPISLQSKLLRVLQEGEIRQIGATAEKKVDVRIVAATNRDGQGRGGLLAAGHGALAELRLAGQRARAAERGPATGHPGGSRRLHHAGHALAARAPD